MSERTNLASGDATAPAHDRVSVRGRGPLLAFFAAAAVAVGLAGFALTGEVLVLAACAAVVLAAAALVFPSLTIAVFWVAYAVQTTIFSDLPLVEGLYYPIYLLMLVNAGVYLLTRHREARLSAWVVLPYALFMLAAGGAALRLRPGSEIDVPKTLFIFSLGLVGAMQIRRRSDRHLVWAAMAVVAPALAIWTGTTAARTAYAYRGGVGVNENWVAQLIGAGLVPMMAWAMALRKRWSWPLRAVLWVAVAGGLYANLLLASRGMSVAVVVALLVVLARSVRKPSHLVIAALALAATAVFVWSLPGTQGYAARWQEGDIVDLNLRTDFWRAELNHLATAGPLVLLLGGGMGTSNALVQGVTSLQTSTHNLYLGILVDCGMLGMLSFVALLIAAFWNGVRSRGAEGAVMLSLATFIAVVGLIADVHEDFVFWLTMATLLPTAGMGMRRRDVAQG